MIAEIEPEAITRGDRALVDHGRRDNNVFKTNGTVVFTLPYDSNLGQATTMNENSNRGGEYIFSLNSKHCQLHLILSVYLLSCIAPPPPPCPCKERLRICLPVKY